MPKRFTDTGIWEKEWYMKLSPKHKCLFKYLTERCDHAGVWEPNWSLATIYIGETVDASDLFVLNDQIEKLPSGKIWVKGFIDFQYGKLSDKSPAHLPIFKSITRNNLSDRVFNRVSNTLMDKDKDMDKEMDKEKEKDSGHIRDSVFSDTRWLEGLQMAHKGKDIEQAWRECFNHHSVSPKPPENDWEWRQKLNTWLTIKKVESKQSTGYDKNKLVQ